ncbi:Forkhead box protein J3 [Gryganskiella cystojenkinii]|nr:Forkhead box protein J3 [Gryganskiella cystojenkinii]
MPIVLESTNITITQEQQQQQIAEPATATALSLLDDEHDHSQRSSHPSKRTLSSKSALAQLKKEISENGPFLENKDHITDKKAVVVGGHHHHQESDLSVSNKIDQSFSISPLSTTTAADAVTTVRLGHKLLSSTSSLSSSHSRCPSPTPTLPSSSSCASPILTRSTAKTTLSTTTTTTTAATATASSANCRPSVVSGASASSSTSHIVSSPLLEIGNTETFSGFEPSLTLSTITASSSAPSLHEKRGKENHQPTTDAPLPPPRTLVRPSRTSSSASTTTPARALLRSSSSSLILSEATETTPSSSYTQQQGQLESSKNNINKNDSKPAAVLVVATTMTATPGPDHAVVAKCGGAGTAVDDEKKIKAESSLSSSETVNDSLPSTTPKAFAAPSVAVETCIAPVVVDPRQKPSISYANLILQAISESPTLRLTLCDIYAWIKDRHPYYRYSSSGWQNSIRHNLSLNKAFQKLERNMGEPGKGCFWTLHKDAHEICAATVCKKSKKTDDSVTLPENVVLGLSDESPSSMTTVTRAKSTSASLPRLNCQRQELKRSTSSKRTSARALTPPDSGSVKHHHYHHPADSVPSPAASEDAEEPMSPRRSGRTRRPPRPKEFDDFTGVHTTPSAANSLSTPPWSPGRDDSEDDEKTEGSCKEPSYQTESASTSGTNKASSMSSSAGTAVSTPVTSQRIRRPPQNLADFVSSEDFKAAPYAKRPMGRPPLNGSMSSPNLLGERGGKLDKKRSRDDLNKADNNQNSSSSGDDSDSDSRQSFIKEFDREMKRERSTSSAEPSGAPLPMSQGSESSTLSRPQLPHRPASVSLSALSHSKRPSEDFSSRTGKKQRRDVERRQQQQSRQRSRSGSRNLDSREDVYERRRREGKREIMVASEDDWSDSDFDFLRDEEENYRLSLRRAGLDDNYKSSANRRRFESTYSSDSGSNDCSAAVGLLMDPSAITYGFDSCDAEYILNFNQGPLFNNVSWPEFSDIKEDALVPASCVTDPETTQLDYAHKEWALLAAAVNNNNHHNGSTELLLSSSGDQQQHQQRQRNDLEGAEEDGTTTRSETPEMLLPLRLEDSAMEAAHAVSELNNKMAAASSAASATLLPSVASSLAKEEDGEFLKDYIGWSLCD